MRLIDADELLARLRKDPLFALIEPYGIEGVIIAAPTIEAEPVRRGRWLAIKEKAPWLVCSECGTYLYNEQKSVTKYCYNCGAKMEERE